MALQEYQRKRSFARTPEPRAGKPRRKAAQALSFVVQLHHARARHYDFRLELDGVLHSWAVPRGPSFRPQDKRLAVEVEDHPLSYGSFEGEIPKGNYGAGHVAVYDNGTWEPEGDPREGLAQGKLYFTLRGERLRGRWRMVRTQPRGGKPQWLLMKLDDEYAGDLEADDLLEGIATPGAGSPARTPTATPARSSEDRRHAGMARADARHRVADARRRATTGCTNGSGTVIGSASPSSASRRGCTRAAASTGATSCRTCSRPCAPSAATCSWMAN